MKSTIGVVISMHGTVIRCNCFLLTYPHRFPAFGQAQFRACICGFSVLVVLRMLSMYSSSKIEAETRSSVDFGMFVWDDKETDI
jgi:hypothetical protein